MDRRAHAINSADVPDVPLISGPVCVGSAMDAHRSAVSAACPVAANAAVRLNVARWVGSLNPKVFVVAAWVRTVGLAKGRSDSTLILPMPA
jgi:hypothetical protein